MTLAELIAAARARLDDTAEPYRWTDAELTAHLNEAEREACLRARLLVEAISAPVTVDQNSVDVDPKVIDIRGQAKLTIGNRVLMLAGTSRDALDWDNPRWETSYGWPEFFALVQDDPKNPVLMLSRRLTAAATLTYRLERYPANDMEDAEDEPEIEERHHRNLIEWACYLALSSRDADNNNDTVAALHERRFTDYFGPRPTARMQRLHAAREPQVITPNPF